MSFVYNGAKQILYFTHVLKDSDIYKKETDSVLYCTGQH